MSLERAGWIGERPYARHPNTGTPIAYVCLKCGNDTLPDPDVFAAHDCENYRDHELNVDEIGDFDINASDAALELAVDLGIDITKVEGTGEDGRVLKGDVKDHAEEADQ